MSNPTVVRFTCQNHVGQIIFDRPPANAYDRLFHQQFNAAIDNADADGEARVVIVRSAIPRFFCAGADIKAFAANSTSDNKQMVTLARNALTKIEAGSQPFIAFIEGHALGGGLEIALACDVRIGVRDDYLLGLPESRLGLLPGNGGSQRLPRVVGASQAKLLLASGDSIDPVEALRIGLLDRLIPENGASLAVERIARSIARSAPLAVAASKRAVRDGMEMPLTDALQLEAQLVDELYDTDDAREGFDAATNKRSPEFKGN